MALVREGLDAGQVPVVVGVDVLRLPRRQVRQGSFSGLGVTLPLAFQMNVAFGNISLQKSQPFLFLCERAKSLMGTSSMGRSSRSLPAMNRR